MRCTTCEYDNPPSVRFCGACGAPFAQSCDNCGSENPPDFKFCGNCGLRLKNAGKTTPRNDIHTEDHAERRQLTVLFCDLVNSTELSEQLDPEDLRDVVRRYQQVVADVVAAMGGHIAQYLGDGVLIYFGFPVAHEDDARRAALASLDIITAIDRLDAELGISVRVRIGIHTGPVVAGDVGAHGRTERLALGQTPNIAARVQSLAAPGEVLLTQDTLAIIGDSVPVTPIGSRALRGVAKPITLYKVEPSKRRGADVKVTEHTPFVGRERELSTMLELLARARAGNGQIVLLRGEPGFGKSRLLQELRHCASDDEITWLICSCSPFHQSSALYPIIELLAHELGIDEGLDEDAIRVRFIDAVTDLQIDTAEASDLLADLFMASPSVRKSTPNANRRREKIMGLLVELLLRMSERRTVGLFVEDLHWADPSTLELLGLLVERIENKRVFGVFAHRPNLVEPWQSQKYETLIELQRLNDRDVTAMVDAWAAGRLPAAVCDALVARTDGVPLFIEEMTRTLLDKHLGSDDSIGAAGVNSLTGLIPATLRDLLTARLDALGEAKETAQLGAVLGREFAFEELLAVSHLSHVELADRLSRITDAGILTRAGAATHALYRFRHALIQDAAYDSILRRTRIILHDQAATVLQSTLAEVDPQRLARHCEGATRWREAIDLYRRAAIEANANGAYAEAIALLEKSLELTPHLPPSGERDQIEFSLLIALAPPMTALHGYTWPGLLNVYKRMRDLAASFGSAMGAERSLSLLYNFWGFYCARADRAETLELADEIQRLADETIGEDTRVIAEWVVGATRFYTGDRTAALPHLTRAVEHLQLSREKERPIAGLGSRLFLAWIVRSVALVDVGQIDQGRASIAQAIAFAEAHGEPFQLVQALSHQAWVALHVGAHPDEIAKIAQRYSQLAEQFGLEGYDGENYFASARVAHGDAAAIDSLRAAVEATRAAGNGSRFSQQLGQLGRAFVTLGRYDEARVCLDEGIERCHTTLAGFLESDHYCLLGEIAWREGHLEKATELLDRAMLIAQQQGTPLFELRAAIIAAEVLQQRQRSADARRLLEDVLAKFQNGFDTPFPARATAMLKSLSSTKSANV